MPPVAARGVRALLLLVTSVGLALGLATTTVYDRPAAAPSIETVCLAAAAASELVVSAIPDAVGGDGADAFALLAVGAAAVGVCLIVVIGRLRLAALLRILRPAAAASGAEARRVAFPPAPTRPLLGSLSVIRI